MRSVISRAVHFISGNTQQDKIQAAQQAAQERQALEEELSAWRSSPLGNYFFNRIHADRLAAMKEVMSVNPYDPEKVQSVQMRYQMIGKIEAYCAAILREAKQHNTSNQT